MHRLTMIGVCLSIGCSAGPPSPAATETTSDVGESTGTADASDSETGETTSTSTSTTSTSAPTTTDSTVAPTTESSTTAEPVHYCRFDLDAPEPFFELSVTGGAPFVDGVVFPLECGGQGLWMFALHPKLGGFDPGGDYPHVSVVVDVEGYDIGPTGHFYQRTESYYIGCEESDGGVFGIVPVFPPDELADLSEVDGLPAQVHVEVETIDGPLAVDALVTLSAPPDLVDQGCIL